MGNDLMLLHRVASDCRKLQGEYFKTRTRWALEAAKAAEGELDALLAEIAPRLAAVREQEHAVGPTQPLIDDGRLPPSNFERRHSRGDVEFRRDRCANNNRRGRDR
jgi:hypothetical protein